jgi:hypothetical protein
MEEDGNILLLAFGGNLGSLHEEAVHLDVSLKILRGFLGGISGFGVESGPGGLVLAFKLDLISGALLSHIVDFDVLLGSILSLKDNHAEISRFSSLHLGVLELGVDHADGRS